MNLLMPSQPLCSNVASRRIAARIGSISLGATSVAGGPVLLPDEQLRDFLVADKVCDVEFDVAFGGRFDSCPGELVFDSRALWKLYRNAEGFCFRLTTDFIGTRPYKQAIVAPEVAARWRARAERRPHHPAPRTRPHLDVRNSLARRRGNRRGRSCAAGWNLCSGARRSERNKAAQPHYGVRRALRAQFRAASLDGCDHFRSGIFQQGYRLRPLLRIFICSGFHRSGGPAP